MDPRSFDSLTRSLAAAKTRRGFLGSLAALGAGLLGARSADAQVTQAQCGNVSCKNNPGKCNPGCVCCAYPNGNSRCRPPGECTAPGTVATTTTTTTAAPCVEGTICGDCKVCSAGACVDHFPVCNQGDCGIKTVDGCSAGTTCSVCPECFTCSNGTCQPAVAGTACATGVCDGGACVPKLAQGQPCTEDGQCTTGFCTDGVCCQERCDGECRRCNLSGLGVQPGTCAGTGGDFAGGPDACGAGGAQTCCNGQCCAAGHRCSLFGCCNGTGCGGCGLQDDCGTLCVSPVPCGACQVCGTGGSCQPVGDGAPCGEFGGDRCCKGQCCNLGEVCTASGCAESCVGCSECQECPLGVCVPKPGLSGHVCGDTCCATGQTTCCGDTCCAGECCNGTCCPAGKSCCAGTDGTRFCQASNTVCNGTCFRDPLTCCPDGTQCGVGQRCCEFPLQEGTLCCEATDTCCVSGFVGQVSCCPAHMTCGVFGCGSV